MAPVTVRLSPGSPVATALEVTCVLPAFTSEGRFQEGRVTVPGVPVVPCRASFSGETMAETVVQGGDDLICEIEGAAVRCRPTTPEERLRRRPSKPPGGSVAGGEGPSDPSPVGDTSESRSSAPTATTKARATSVQGETEGAGASTPTRPGEGGADERPALFEAIAAGEWQRVNAAAFCKGLCTVGSPANEEGRFGDDWDRREVAPPPVFWLQRTEVTQAQWDGVLARARELELPTLGVPSNPSGFRGPRRPVETVSWCDAARFANLWTTVEAKRTGREDLAPVYTVRGGTAALEGCGETAVVEWDRSRRGYRLPTEEEWEVAARGGTTTRFASGDEESDLAKVGWFGNPGGETHDVAQLAPTSVGLYDMHGNVDEWTWSLYDPSESNDPGAGRVGRGGSFGGSAQLARSANRVNWLPVNRYSFLGFRLVRAPAPQP